MNQVEIVDVDGCRARFTVTQRHPDAVGMSVVLEEDLLKVVATKAFGLNEDYKSMPTAPLGHELGSDEVLFEESAPALFQKYFTLVEANVVRERADSDEIRALLDSRGLNPASAEGDYAYHAEYDARRGLMHLTIQALEPRWTEHLKAGDKFEM